jgi:hypothetical protein
MARNMNSLCPAGLRRRTLAVLLFGISFGYVEAAVVTYLRPQFDVVRATFIPQSIRGDLFPMLSLQQIETSGSKMVKLVGTEVAREAATLVMLGAVAVAVGENFEQGLAFFMLAFGAWDIAYYVFLKVLVDWPKSLLTWDVLFLIPVPWTGPVAAPALVALTMIGTGLLYLHREFNNHSLRPRAVHWTSAGVGTALVLASFTWDYRNIMAGGMPNPFHWPVFALGELVWLAALLHVMAI